MAGLNGKGPLNHGPMTGRGAGRCGGGNRNGKRMFAGQGFGRGRGQGFLNGQMNVFDNTNRNNPVSDTTQKLDESPVEEIKEDTLEDLNLKKEKLEEELDKINEKMKLIPEK